MQKRILQYADHLFRIGDKALVYSEKYDKWIDPYTVIYVDERMLTERILDGTHKYLFNSFQLKSYFETCDVQHPLSNTDKENKKRRHAVIGISRTIYKGDPRESLFQSAKEKELKSPAQRGTWIVVQKDDVSENANIRESRFVLVLKDEGTTNKVWKAHFVMKEY